MKTVLILAEVLFLYIVASGQSLSPQLLTSAGDKCSNSYYQMDWSIGELVTETFNSGQNILTQGFNQGNYFVTSTQNLNGLDIGISAFPNPTSDFIQLQIGVKEIENLDYQITGLSGTLLIKSKLDTAQLKLDFSVYPIGIYILTITKNKALIKSFIIIKK